MDAIDDFLDSADLVLNSDTFLLEIPLLSPDLEKEVAAFMASESFQRSLLKADIARGWFNMHTFTNSEELVPKPGNVVKPDFYLKLRQSTIGAKDYLEAMLTADGRKGNFHSFYRRQKNAFDAERLASAFLRQISGGKDLSLYILEPDFLVDSPTDPDNLYYFEGKGCDNTALITTGESGYLLLTNGIP